MYKLIVLTVVIAGMINWWNTREIRHGPGVTAPTDPMQEMLDVPSSFDHLGYSIEPLASFNVHARVLGKERYRMDSSADLVPIDLALGWGPMSDESVLEQIDIRQSNRYFHWSVDEFPIPRSEIEQHASNMHIIPANKEIGDRLSRLRVGQLVEFSGYLVAASRPGGWHFSSSLSRKDTGAGACELVWMEELIIH